MTMQNYFIITSEQRTALLQHNNDDVAIDPRAIDNATPGVGINLSDLTELAEPGAPVTLTGKYIAPKRVVDDPEYVRYVPELLTDLLELPWATLEDETIFAPSVGPGGVVVVTP